MTGKYLLLALLATAAFAQDPVSITPYQLIDARAGNAIACSNCSIYTYAAGTNTPLATYTSSTLATPNTNPVLTNSAGYAVNGATITGIWVGSSCYKFVAKDSSAVTLFTQDNICDRGAVLKALLATSAGAGLIGFQPTGGTVPMTVASALNSFIIDSGFGTFSGACSSAAGLSKTLMVTSLWSIPAGSYPCNVWFLASGKVRADVGAAVGFTGKITAPESQWIIDVTTNAGASISSFTSPPAYIPANWFGPVGDDSTDNATRLAAAYSVSKLTHTKTVLAPGIYRYTAPLLLDGQASGFCGPMLAGGNGTNAVALKRINDAIGIKVTALAVEVCNFELTGTAVGTTVGIQIGAAATDATGLNMHGVFVRAIGGHCYDLQRVNASIIDVEGLACGGNGLNMVSASGVDVNGNDVRRAIMTGMTGSGVYLSAASTNHFGTVVTQGNGTGVTLTGISTYNVFDFIYEEGDTVASVVINGASAFANSVTARPLGFAMSGSGLNFNNYNDQYRQITSIGLQLVNRPAGPKLTPTAFGDLPIPGNATSEAPEGTMRILYNGTPGSPCTVGAKVVIAISMGGVWNCSTAFN